MHDHDLDLIAAFAEGSLDPDAARRAEDLVASCSSCREEYEAQRFVLSVIVETPSPALTEMERARLHRAVTADLDDAPVLAKRAEREGLVARLRGRRSRPFSSRPFSERLVSGLAVAAVLVLVVGIAGALLRSGDDGAGGADTAALDEPQQGQAPPDARSQVLGDEEETVATAAAAAADDAGAPSTMAEMAAADTTAAPAEVEAPAVAGEVAAPEVGEITPEAVSTWADHDGLHVVDRPGLAEQLRNDTVPNLACGAAADEIDETDEPFMVAVGTYEARAVEAYVFDVDDPRAYLLDPADDCTVVAVLES